ncbi:MAG: thioredoxin domain-containing protein [Planctomycetota bacterium]
MKYAIGMIIAVTGIGLLVFAMRKTDNEKSGTPGVETVSFPCLLDFWMEGCVSCKRTLPIVEAVKKKHAGKLRVECIDINRNPEMKKRFRVNEVPALIFFDVAGKEVHRHNGVIAREEMDAILNRLKLIGNGARVVEDGRSLESLVALLEAAPGEKSEHDVANVGAGISQGFMVYYFHGNMRSGCSHGLEDAARETLSKELKSVLQAKDLVWNTLDIEEPGNMHWVKTFNLTLEDYDLSRGIAVLVAMDGGKPKRWRVIGDLATHRGDPDALVEYVRNNTAEFLKGTGK